jgi:hypothetical protein
LVQALVPGQVKVLPSHHPGLQSGQISQSVQEGLGGELVVRRQVARVPAGSSELQRPAACQRTTDGPGGALHHIKGRPAAELS